MKALLSNGGQALWLEFITSEFLIAAGGVGPS